MSGEKDIHGATGPEDPTPSRPEQEPRKPWPMAWILIVILAYITLQTAYFLLYGD